MDKAEIFERLNQCRQALLETLEKIPKDELINELVEGQWTIKEIICHLTAWELTVLEPLSGFVQINEFKPALIEDHDLWNAEQTASREAMDIQQVLDELEATRELLISEASLLSVEQWDQVLPAPWGGQGCIANLLSGLAWHENEHLQTIQLWRQRRLHSA
jgi:uncharacterized damage-inducible protein DinB